MSHFDPDEFDGTEMRSTLQRIRSLGDAFTDEDFERSTPPDAVWTAIATQLAEERRVTASANPSVVGDAPTVISFDEARSRRTASRPRALAAPFAAAAAVAVLVGVIFSVTSGEDGPATVELATAPLTELADSGASARATLVEDRDGHYRVELADAQMPPPPEGFFYEIWLVDPDVTDPRSLSAGSMGDRVGFDVPDGIDPAKYPIIDVSLEPDDGNPAHAGVEHSVARGVLEL